MYASYSFLLNDNNLFRRRIYTSNCISTEYSKFNWYISHEGDNKIAIKNQGTNDYLCAASNDIGGHGQKNHQKGLDWVLGTKEIQGIWELDCFDKLVSI